jgi:transcriptional regulator with XRE-family HTH domain
MAGLFWDDLARDLDDPEFVRGYVAASVKIATTDAMINALDEARASAGMSKAELARVIGTEPATVRRLFSSHSANPTLGTLAAIAAALGLRVSVEPLSGEDKESVTEPLRTGKITEAGARRVAELRTSRRAAIPA